MTTQLVVLIILPTLQDTEANEPHIPISVI